MPQREFCYLYLTCENTISAGEIVRVLLNKRLIACAKQMPVSSNYWHKDKTEQSTEVLLAMESATDLFNQIEKEVDKLHTYETFVLTAIPLDKVSAKAQQWLKESLRAS